MYLSFIRKAFVLFLLLSLMHFSFAQKQTTLKDAYIDKFYIGTAMNAPQITGRDIAAVNVIKENFNAIVAENCMKSGPLQPREGEFDFELADQFVKFGVENDMSITGHCLIWHSQTPHWFFTDDDGSDVSAEMLMERMKSHIHTVVGRYKGKVHGWDVVNEAIEDDGRYRNSKFYQILGEDFIKYAFQFAHEADPDAELYYNDYSMANPLKREGVVKMVEELQAQGLRIDGVGMQTHVDLHYPKLSDFEASMEAFAALGVNVLITEMDVSVLPTPNFNLSADITNNIEYQEKYNPYIDGLPDSVRVAFDKRYVDFFKLFLKHKDYITRVTLWGVNDGNTWKNNFPVKGRTDYPLLFDRDYRAKSVVPILIDMAVEN